MEAPRPPLLPCVTYNCGHRRLQIISIINNASSPPAARPLSTTQTLFLLRPLYCTFCTWPYNHTLDADIHPCKHLSTRPFVFPNPIRLLEFSQLPLERCQPSHPCVIVGYPAHHEQTAKCSHHSTRHSHPIPHQHHHHTPVHPSSPPQKL